MFHPKRYLLGFFTLVIHITILPSAPAESARIRVACLGDSITFGARVDAKTESYPSQLQKILGDAYEVRNFGLGSATLIQSGKPNVWQTLPDVRRFEPDLVVISLGTNDTVSGQRQNWERIDSFEPDYLRLIQTLSAYPSEPQILICTPTAMVLETPGLSADRLANLKQRKPRLQTLCDRIRKIVEGSDSERVLLLELNPTLEGRPELLTAKDGVHPNRDGYRAIAQTVAGRIKRLRRPPNLILFLVDDMGWQDTSVPFHSEVTPLNRRYRTPNMRQLADRGMKFTQAYACSVCSPTRVSLMTGMNAARHRVTNWTLRKNASNDRRHSKLEFPLWNVNSLSPEAGIERTIHTRALPAFLKESGYHTIHIGKAHFGAVGTPGSDPCNIGFDVNIGGHAAGGPGSFLGTQNFSAVWRKGDKIWNVPGLQQYHQQDIFLTEALTREAIQEMNRAVADDKPFFLYMSHYAVHVPFAEDSRFYATYRDNGLNHTEAMYAAMVEGMDKSLGDLVANVASHDLTDNTIIMFMSDNGGLSAQGRGGKPNTHNLPLSSGKGSAHEGGVRVPMIVAWPGVTPAKSICNQPVIIEDFFPTLLELAGVDSSRGAEDLIDGMSFVNLLHGERDQARQDRPLIWHFPNNWGPKGPGIGPSSTIRLGDWKLIYYHESQDYELFDLSKDLSETTNLAQTLPEQKDRLAKQLGSLLRARMAQMPTVKATGRAVPYPGEE